MLLDGRVLDFYKWDGDVKELLQASRVRINQVRTVVPRPPTLRAAPLQLPAAVQVAEGWTREQKDRCLEETPVTFQMAGPLLKSMSDA